MKGKIIATMLALGMVVTAFAAVSMAAQGSHVFITTSDGGSGNIANAADTTTADGGLARIYDTIRPGQVLFGPTTPNPATSHQIIGTMVPQFAQVDAEGFLTPSVFGEPIIMTLERDTAATVDPTYGQISTLGAAHVPSGYVCSPPACPWDAAVEPQWFGDSTLTKIPSPTLTATNVNWVAMAGVPNIYGYGVLQSASNNGPWTEVGQSTGTTLVYAPIANNWYSLVIYWQGTGGGFLNTQSVRGVVYSAPTQFAIAANIAPVADTLAYSPVPHNGNTLSEQVTLTARITDANGADTLNASYRVDNGAWMNFAQTGVSPLNTLSAVWNFPNGAYAEGAHPFEVRGYDGTDYSVVASSTFTITDSTAPVASFSSEPATPAYKGSALTFVATYNDFTNMNNALANSYFWYSINLAAPVNVAWTQGTLWYGSYNYNLTATIPGATTATWATGDSITYGGRVTDTRATVPQLITNFGGIGPIIMADPPTIFDPYPVWGVAQLYDGNGGLYSPNPAPIGTQVTLTWMDYQNPLLPVPASTVTTTITALGQYTVDLTYVALGSAINATATIGANVGYNYTTVTAPGGSLLDVLCGVPYEVVISAPANATTVAPGVPTLVTYQILDINGVIAPGYYTFTDGPMHWTTGDVAAIPGLPADQTFNGILTGGTITVGITLLTPGMQWINISEFPMDWYPTPWNNFMTRDPATGAAIPGWLDDFDQIWLNVASGFDWLMVGGGGAGAWNMISCPQDPLDKGLNGIFDAADALRIANAQFPDPNMVLAVKQGVAMPTVYTMYTLLSAEDGVRLDGVHAYWLYSEVAVDSIVHINALDYTFGAGENIVTTQVGWNMLGFTHNGSVAWTLTPTAGDFTDGTISAPLNVPGMTKIIATEWLYGTQVYYSCVVTTTFPIMPTRSWLWDLTWGSTHPGNGFWLWTESSVVVTFDVEY